MQTKHVIMGIAVALIAVLGVSLVGALILDSINNSHTGTTNTDGFDVIVNNTNMTEGYLIDWGPLSVGNTTLPVSITNKPGSIIQVFLYITSPPETWLTVTFSGNNTIIQVAETRNYDLTATLDASAPDQTVVTWNSKWTAETTS